MPAIPRHFPVAEWRRGAWFVSVMAVILAVMIVNAIAGLADQNPPSKQGLSV